MRRLAVISGAQTELYELIFKEKEEESKEEESKEEEKKEKEEELGEKRENSMAIVMFPGNPGVLGFYFDFLTSIYQHFDQKVSFLFLFFFFSFSFLFSSFFFIAFYYFL